MKHIHWTIAILIFVLAFFWSSRVHDYFYGVTTADQFGFLIVTIAGTLFFSRFTLKESNTKPLLVTSLLLLAIFAIYPAVSKLILFTDLSWLIIYVLLILTSFCLVYLFQSRFLFLILIGFVLVFYMPYEFIQEQRRFYDRVESSIQTRQGEAQVVQWKEDFWLYYNKQLQYSTLDKHLYQEAYVQPVLQLIGKGSKVLLIGGDNGIIEDELTMFEGEVSLTLLGLDSEFHEFARGIDGIPLKQFTEKEEVFGTGVFDYLDQNPNQFDLIIIDVPDPVNLDFSQYYTVELYELVDRALTEEGLLVTQSGDFYKNGIKAQEIWNSISEVGLNVLPLQCQIPTIGQWSWAIGSKDQSAVEMKKRLSEISPTTAKWWNQEAANLMLSFGKDYFPKETNAVNYLVNAQPSSE